MVNDSAIFADSAADMDSFLTGKAKPIYNNEFVFLGLTGYLTGLLCAVYLEFGGGEKGRGSGNNGEMSELRKNSFQMSSTPAKQWNKG